ncbi:hypothetical protein C0J52_00704 [Blattella germanica]|nr:hypothetical protein C0J52_00704 [Blattella germanica]
MFCFKCRRVIDAVCVVEVVQAWRVNGAMVHSEAGPGARAMFYRDTAAGNTSLGLPKSPSFHSGLDLVAAATDPGSNTVAGLSQVSGGVDPTGRGGTQNGDSAPGDMLIYSDTGLPRQLPSLLGKYAFHLFTTLLCSSSFIFPSSFIDRWLVPDILLWAKCH